MFIETRPDHNYSRPWIDDPTIATALPRVQLFFNSNAINDLNVDVDDNDKFNEENLGKINWAPTINTIIPETLECPEEIDENLTSEQEIFVRNVRELINETRIAALCCELVLLNISFDHKIKNPSF
jgi:hypothetical protein